MSDNRPHRSARARVARPALTVIGAYVCAVLAMTGASVLFQGLTTGDFGWVRHFGAVSLDARPAAFAAVAVMYAAAAVVTGWAGFKLVTRLRHRGRTE